MYLITIQINIQSSFKSDDSVTLKINYTELGTDAQTIVIEKLCISKSKSGQMDTYLN